MVQPYKGKHLGEQPTQLMEYIIQTYNAPKDTVLDTCTGSGTTAIAAKNLDRKFIGSEMGEAEFNQVIKRIEKTGRN